MRPDRSYYDFRLGGRIAIALLVAAGILAAANPALLRRYPDMNFANGSWASAYQKGFDKGLAIRERSTSLLALVNYMAFREGRSGVLIGRDGWLFSSEEMTPLSDPQTAIRPKLDYVKKTVAQLRERNIRVVVALIPAKLRIYPEHGGRYHMLPQLRGVYSQILEQLRADQIQAPDLRPALRAGKRYHDEFLHTDTHWTSQGARDVANALAEAIGDHPSWKKTRYRFVAGPLQEHQGDLKNFLPLGPWADEGPRADMIQTGKFVPVSSSASGLLGASYQPVVLVGTSYSFNPHWRFEGALKQALEADVLNVSREGQGPFRPMANYLDDPDAAAAPPKLLIWEMPERYFWSTDKTVGLPS